MSRFVPVSDPEKARCEQEKDVSNNFPRGHFIIGKKIVVRVLDHTRKLAESYMGVQALMVFDACGGGTGSSSACLMLERLSVDYVYACIMNVITSARACCTA